MKTQMIDIKTPDGVCDAFIAYPEDKGRYPAVLFLMDGFGLRDYLYEMAKTIAAQGYYVLAPNLLYRIRRAPVLDIKFPVRKEELPEIRNRMAPIFQSFNQELAMKDIAVFLDFLGQQPQAKPGKIGVTGYCLGGGLAIRTAALFPDRIAAAASFHGARLATEAPDSPHLLVNRIKAELYIAHATNDQNMTPEQIERLHKALEQSNVRYKAEIYDGPHGFTMADLPMHHEPSLKRHWENLFELLKKNL